MADPLVPFPKTQAQRVQYWKTFDRKRWQFLRWGEDRVKKALDGQVQGVLDNLEGGLSNAIASVDATVRKAPMEEAFKDIYGRVGAYYAVRIFDGFKAAYPAMERKEEHEDRFLRFMREWIAANGVERISQITSNTRDKLRKILQKGIQEGLSIDDIAKQITQGSQIAGSQRARVIARTEIISASNKGSIQGARATNLNLNKEWIATQDSRTRFEHAGADGQVVGMEEPFNVGGEQLDYPGDPSGSAGNVIQCFTGDTKVSFDSCKKSIRSRYSGKLITIKTAGGFQLTGTPNHPVMTDRGFIRLDKVDHSTNLVCCPLNRNIIGNLDVDNIPLTFEQFHNSVSPISTGSMRVSGVNVDLYGRSPNSKVDIINIDGLLWHNIKALVLKSGLEGLFKIPHLTKGFLFLFRRLYTNFLPVGVRHIGRGLMGRLNLFLSLFLRHLFPFERFCFRLASNGDIVIKEPSANNVTGDAQFISNGIFTYPRSVHINNFVNVNASSVAPAAVSPFSETFEDKGLAASEMISDFLPGHSRFVHIDNPVSVEVEFAHNKFVYTLETRKGIYNAGGIISTNCRCTQGYQRK